MNSIDAREELRRNVSNAVIYYYKEEKGIGHRRKCMILGI